MNSSAININARRPVPELTCSSFIRISASTARQAWFRRPPDEPTKNCQPPSAIGARTPSAARHAAASPHVASRSSAEILALRERFLPRAGRRESEGAFFRKHHHIRRACRSNRRRCVIAPTDPIASARRKEGQGRRAKVFARPRRGNRSASSGPEGRPVSASLSGMNNALPLRPSSP